MITAICSCCGKEKDLNEDKLTDLRCASPGCTCKNIVFKQDIERQSHSTGNWDSIKADEEVQVGERVGGTLNSYLWVLKKVEVKKEEPSTPVGPIITEEAPVQPLKKLVIRPAKK